MLVNPFFPPSICSLQRRPGVFEDFSKQPNKTHLFILSFPPLPEVMLLKFISCKLALER